MHDTSTESSESAEITQAQPDSVEPDTQVLEGSSPSATPTIDTEIPESAGRYPSRERNKPDRYGQYRTHLVDVII